MPIASSSRHQIGAAVFTPDGRTDFELSASPFTGLEMSKVAFPLNLSWTCLGR